MRACRIRNIPGGIWEKEIQIKSAQGQGISIFKKRQIKRCIHRDTQGGYMRKPKVSRTLIILALALLVAVPAFGQWQTETRISNTPQYSYTTYYGGWAIAADTNNVHIVWRDYYYPDYMAKHVMFPVGTPPAPGPGTLISSTSERANYPVVAVDYTGKAQVSWDYGYDMWFREYDAGWGSIRDMGYGYNYPAIANDDDGNTHFAINRYSRGRQVYYRRRDAGSSSFTSPVLVHNPGYYRYAYRPSITVTSDGVIHMSFGSNNGYRLIHAWSTDNGASWNTENLTGTYECYYSYATSICHDSEDNLYIAYTSYNRPRHIYVISGNTGNWGTPEQVDQSTYRYVYYPSICCDTADNIWVAWDDRSGADYEIYYNRMDGETGTWDGFQPLTQDDDQFSRRASLAADPHGNVHICWYDYRDYSSGGRYEIYYNWFKATTGPGPEEDSLDLIMEQVIRPYAVEEPAAFVPACLIWQNLEDTTIEAEVVCRITNLGNMQVDYEDVIHAYPLDPGYNQVSAFKSFTPEINTEYEAFFVVNHPDDIDVNNNDKNQRFSTEARAQVDPIDITTPQLESEVDTMTPAANFKNVGSETAENFYCYCEILPEGYLTPDYIDSVAVASLDPEAEVAQTFAQWVCDDSSGYVARFFAAIPGGERELLGEEEFVSFLGIPYTGIAEEPLSFGLDAIKPNPFAHRTSVSFSVAKAASVSVKVYDVSGKLVETLADGTFSAGSHKVKWNADVAPGVYFVRFLTPSFDAVEKVMVIR
ncbi:T9SS type A sorting domain-containing protein [candidate division WOR-3 bacterium]|uniref:T9SS type A sorting domain-containing protein n=1 Tax=candidate division WOR-3 bacterium TaxID=2052148 RepID=A0A9D5KA19_UNCW3|nr:T9SS type A sorting domain-containing protein [candidate division WOR-3 bacterium]MBD3365253.1 T9SS type A sorting domain-containing protein [candidate division WOR-3 bacterium]